MASSSSTIRMVFEGIETAGFSVFSLKLAGVAKVLTQEPAALAIGAHEVGHADPGQPAQIRGLPERLDGFVAEMTVGQIQYGEPRNVAAPRQDGDDEAMRVLAAERQFMQAGQF